MTKYELLQPWLAKTKIQSMKRKKQGNLAEYLELSEIILIFAHGNNNCQLI